MATVICDMSMSLDGYVTGPNDSRENPFGDTPCFVVTHNKPATPYPAVFTFVTDGVASAIEQAKHVAGDKVVGLHGATVIQQALPLGLVEEIRMHVIPVLLGAGMPLFGTLASPITLERTQALITPAATHIGFRVMPLHQENRQRRTASA